MTPNSRKTRNVIRSLLPRRNLAILLGLLFIMFLVMAVPGGTAGADPLYLDRDILVASNYTTESGAALGSSVATSGDTIVVGAPAENEWQGAVYVYTRPETGWTDSDAKTQTAKLTLHDITIVPKKFGSSVSISGDTIVVGAENDSGQGAAYVFVRSGDTWTDSDQHDAKLTKETPVNLDAFGDAVSISGDTIVVGAPASNNLTGEAFVFVRPPTGWITATPTAVLSNTLSMSEDDFGAAVAINADTVVVGAQYDDVGEDGSENTNQGSAYVYVKPESGWIDDNSPDAHLTSAGGNDFDLFGASVAIREDGKVVVVGAEDAERPVIPPAPTNERNDAFPKQGAAYVFMRPSGGWVTDTEDAVLSSGSAGASNDGFGGSVSISGDTIVVGAYQFGVGSNPNQGAAFAFVQPTVGTVGEAWAPSETPIVLADTVNGETSDMFGESVAVFGGTIVAGVPSDDLPVTAATGAAEQPQDIEAAPVKDQGSAYVFMNAYCSKQSGDWHSDSTWVGDGIVPAEENTVPSESDDACISTNHTVDMDAAAAVASVNNVQNDIPTVRRLLVNPGAVLDLNTFEISVNQHVTNNGTLAQEMTQTAGTGLVEVLKIQSGDSGTKYRGADVNSSSDLGGISVTVRTAIDWFSPTSKYAYCTTDGAASPAYVNRCFNIKPAVGDQESTVTLWALLDELNGIVDLDDVPDGLDVLMVYHFVTNKYEPLSPATVGKGFLGINYVSVSGTTSGFSDFLIGDKDLKPTAVDLINLAVGDAFDMTAVLVTVVAFLALVSLGLWAVVRRKRA